MTQARMVVVTGRVQGVGFRAFTRDTARDLGVAGWVRNRDDGAVEAVVEGEAETLDTLIAQLKSGPAPARVERIETADATPTGRDGFDIV